MQVRFLSQQETASFIYRDLDGYIRSMSPFDVRARGAESKHQYRAHAASSATSIDQGTSKRLIDACSAVDYSLMHDIDVRAACTSYGMNPDVMAALPWCIALTQGTAYEEGLPHTRENTILISTEFFDGTTIADNCRTLLHEKVHLYQRRYRKACTERLFRLGYSFYTLRKQLPMIRCNPDLDGIVYSDPEGRILACCYRNTSPKSIRDVMYMSPCRTEHPFERVAYEIGDLLQK